MNAQITISYDKIREQYAVFKDSKFIGYALDLQAVCDLIHLLERENE